jgi:hypothetical protein
LAGSNSFALMQPITGTTPTASSSTDTLTFTSSDSSISVIGNSTTKTLDFKRAGTDAGITQLTGDVTAGPGNGSQAATVVSIGASTAANVHAAELLANAATSSNTTEIGRAHV